MARELCGRRWLYRRAGYDERSVTFGLDGTVGDGAAGCERWWGLGRDDGIYSLSLIGPDGPARWHGAWVVHERMPVELLVQY